MALTQVKVPVAPDPMGHSIPGIDLYLVSDGSIVFVPTPRFVPHFEQCLNGMTAMFDAEGFAFFRNKESADGTEATQEVQEFEWMAAYNHKENELMKEWLVQQNLQRPW